MPQTKRKANALSDGDSPTSGASKKMPANSSRTRPEDNPCPPELPAAAWGNVLNFLHYCDVRKSLLICRAVAFDAPDFVHSMCISNACEMNVRAARKFSNIWFLAIKVLNSDQILDTAAIGRVVSFMSTFPQLKDCLIGGQTCGGRLTPYALESCKGPTGHNQNFRSMLEASCGAFETEALPISVNLRGFLHLLRAYRCTPAVEEPQRKCSLCRRILHSFPLNSIIAIPGRKDRSLKKQAGGLDRLQQFCIPFDECMAIIRNRNWTQTCKDNPLPSSFFLQLRGIRKKEFKGGTLDTVYFLPKGRFEQIELLLDLGSNTIKKDIKDRGRMMRQFQRWKPKGGYPLLRSTFDRLVRIGVNVDGRDFLLVDGSDEADFSNVIEHVRV